MSTPVDIPYLCSTSVLTNSHPFACFSILLFYNHIITLIWRPFKINQTSWIVTLLFKSQHQDLALNFEFIMKFCTPSLAPVHIQGTLLVGIGLNSIINVVFYLVVKLVIIKMNLTAWERQTRKVSKPVHMSNVTRF